MADRNVFFLENLEWFDETGKEIVHRLPQEGSGEIKWGAQLTVRESQAAVFFYKGKAVGVFGPGRHTLKTGNIPLLTMESPLRAEVYFVNLKVFTNLKWGTRDPVAYKDAELGLVRLRAFGVFNLQVAQPVLLINTLVGTQGAVTTEAVEDYLNQVIVSRFNDYMGQTLDSLLNLPARYDELSQGLNDRLQEDLGRFGIRLTELYISSDRALHQLHHPAAGGPAGHRRPQPHGRVQGHGKARADEGGDGHGESRRRGWHGGLRDGRGARPDAARHVRQRPDRRQARDGVPCRGRQLPGVPERRAGGLQVLSPVRAPAGGVHPVLALRQEPGPQRPVLPALRPGGGCGAGQGGLPRLRR